MSVQASEILRQLSEPVAKNSAANTKLMNDIFDILLSSEGQFITPRVREKIRERFPKRWENELQNIRTYTPLGNEKGSTYLPVCGVSPRYQNQGLIYYIRIREKAKDKFPGSAKHFKNEFKNAIEALKALIKEFNSVIIPDNFCSELDFVIVTRAGEIVDEPMEGRSAELPLALALFSHLTGKDLISSVISTGALDGPNVRSVDGLKEKSYAAFYSHTEIEKFIVAANDKALIPDEIKSNLQVIEVADIGDALSLCFPDYKQLISDIKLKGLTGYTWKKIKIHNTEETGTEFVFSFIDGYQFNPSILKDFEDFKVQATNLLIINNARINWLASFLVAKVKNSVNTIAIYDPKLSKADEGLFSAVIVQSNDSQKKPGDIINYLPADE